MNGVTLDDVDPGRHDWPTRARYCGLDQAAVEDFAKKAGHLDPDHANFASGGLAVFMPYAIATSFDRLATHLKKMRPWGDDDFRELLGVLAYAWAVATQVGNAHEARDDLVDAQRKKEIGNIVAALANQPPPV